MSTKWKEVSSAGFSSSKLLGFLGGSDTEELPCNAQTSGFSLWIGKIPWRREWLSTPVVLSGEFHEQRSLVGYCPWGHQESDTTEQLTQKHTKWDEDGTRKPWTEGLYEGEVSGPNRTCVRNQAFLRMARAMILRLEGGGLGNRSHRVLHQSWGAWMLP